MFSQIIGRLTGVNISENTLKASFIRFTDLRWFDVLESSNPRIIPNNMRPANKQLDRIYSKAGRQLFNLAQGRSQTEESVS